MINIIQKLAYELSCDEVKLMVDKLENGDVELQRELVRLYQISRMESFYFWERLAVAPIVRRLRRQGLKVAIAETVFHGADEMRELPRYVPGKTIYQDRV